MDNLSNIFILQDGKSGAITAENPRGEKGRGGTAASPLGPSRKGRPCIRLKSGTSETIAEIIGPGIIRHIWITVPDRTSDEDRYVLRDLILKIYWDDEEIPAVIAPLGDFFCCGFAVETIVNALPIVVCPTRGMNCYFPMPFLKKAKIIIENQHPADINGFFYQVDYALMKDLPGPIGYFHAQWRRERITEKAKDFTILDNVSGKGQYVGTYLALATLERYWWGEGEFKFYIDGDRKYPTICGTGTEDYFGGSWSFAAQVDRKTVEQTYCTPFLGYPFYSAHDTKIHNPYHNDDAPPMRGLYRFHIPDPILFSENIRVTVQQIGVNFKGLFERQDDIAATAYWYLDKAAGTLSVLPPREDRWPR